MGVCPWRVAAAIMHVGLDRVDPRSTCGSIELGPTAQPPAGLKRPWDHAEAPIDARHDRGRGPPHCSMRMLVISVTSDARGRRPDDGREIRSAETLRERGDGSKPSEVWRL